MSLFRHHWKTLKFNIKWKGGFLFKKLLFRTQEIDIFTDPGPRKEEESAAQENCTHTHNFTGAPFFHSCTFWQVSGHIRTLILYFSHPISSSYYIRTTYALLFICSQGHPIMHAVIKMCLFLLTVELNACIVVCPFFYDSFERFMLVRPNIERHQGWICVDISRYDS